MHLAGTCFPDGALESGGHVLFISVSMADSTVPIESSEELSGNVCSVVGKRRGRNLHSSVPAFLTQLSSPNPQRSPFYFILSKTPPLKKDPDNPSETQEQTPVMSCDENGREEVGKGGAGRDGGLNGDGWRLDLGW